MQYWYFKRETYVESAAGIGAGGRTGLTALVVAICFAISSFFSPLLAIVPTAATAPILIIVGIMMLASLKNIHWDDMSEAVPAFFTSIFMGFSYSITQGIAVGFLTYTLTKIVKGQAKDVHVMIWILDALFILNYISTGPIIELPRGDFPLFLIQSLGDE